MKKVLRRFVTQYSSSLRMPLNPYSPNDNLAPGYLIGQKTAEAQKNDDQSKPSGALGRGK